MAKDYYKILGVKKTDSKDTIKKAYRDAVKRLHPDVKGGKFDKKRFYEIQEAYETLGDEEKRRMYDRNQEEATARPRRFWRGERPSPFWQDPETFWRDRGRHAVPPRAHQATLRLTPEEAMTGGVLTLRVPLGDPCPFCVGTGVFGLFTCPVCGGHGAARQVVPVEISIPSGVQAGTVLRVPFEDVAGHAHLLFLKIEIAWFA